MNFVPEREGRDLEDYEIGLIGRDKKELDRRELKVVYICHIPKLDYKQLV
ncbi:MAG TPA: hypothetical protein VJG66_00905 [Patescibacteria group bacterium]|nr:hypothetical protein [Patescibacteria group bacterium]